MLKIEAILDVYTSDMERSNELDGEEITAWYIDEISKEELQKIFTEEEIEYIYYNVF
jgi:hypothetical protein